MNIKTTKQILKEIKRNRNILDNCEHPHNFIKSEVRGMFSLRESYICSKCGGECTSANVSWYNKGLKHGSSV